MISVDDLYQEAKNKFALQTLVDMVDTKMLEKEYKVEVKNAKDYASSTIAGMTIGQTDTPNFSRSCS